MKQIDKEKVIKLWENGLTDSEIAKELGCGKTVLWNLRTSNDMGSNVGLFGWKEREANGKAKRV